MVKFKSCPKCRTENALGLDIEEHNCHIMDVAVSLELCVKLYDTEYEIYLGYIISDNNNTTRYHLSNKVDVVKLPEHNPPPYFYADPSHQIKVMVKPIFKLAKSEWKNLDKCEKIDTLQLKNTPATGFNRIMAYLLIRW